MDGVTVNNLSLSLGKAPILQGVSAQFPKGEITGIVGRNGSGKSMLLKCICGFIRPNAGEIWVFGQNYLKARAFPPSVGFVIEAPGFWGELSALENLYRLACIQSRLKRGDLQRALEAVGLNPNDRKAVRKFSLGMKQRLGIAQAIMEDPQLLILDEPMNGLDNAGVRDMRALFKQMRDAGKTMILTSHNAQDIDELCGAVYEMDGGVMQRAR